MTSWIKIAAKVVPSWLAMSTLAWAAGDCSFVPMPATQTGLTGVLGDLTSITVDGGYTSDTNTGTCLLNQEQAPKPPNFYSACVNRDCQALLHTGNAFVIPALEYRRNSGTAKIGSSRFGLREKLSIYQLDQGRTHLDGAHGVDFVLWGNALHLSRQPVHVNWTMSPSNGQTQWQWDTLDLNVGFTIPVSGMDWTFAVKAKDQPFAPQGIPDRFAEYVYTIIQNPGQNGHDWGWYLNFMPPTNNEPLANHDSLTNNWTQAPPGPTPPTPPIPPATWTDHRVPDPYKLTAWWQLDIASPWIGAEFFSVAQAKMRLGVKGTVEGDLEHQDPVLGPIDEADGGLVMNTFAQDDLSLVPSLSGYVRLVIKLGWWKYKKTFTIFQPSLPVVHNASLPAGSDPLGFQIASCKLPGKHKNYPPCNDDGSSPDPSATKGPSPTLTGIVGTPFRPGRPPQTDNPIDDAPNFTDWTRHTHFRIFKDHVLSICPANGKPLSAQDRARIERKLQGISSMTDRAEACRLLRDLLGGFGICDSYTDLREHIQPVTYVTVAEQQCGKDGDPAQPSSIFPSWGDD